MLFRSMTFYMQADRALNGRGGRPGSPIFSRGGSSRQVLDKGGPGPPPVAFSGSVPTSPNDTSYSPGRWIMSTIAVGYDAVYCSMQPGRIAWMSSPQPLDWTPTIPMPVPAGGCNYESRGLKSSISCEQGESRAMGRSLHLGDPAKARGIDCIGLRVL